MQEEFEYMEDKSYDSMISTIATKLAVNKYNLLKGKKVNFDAEKQANELEVVNKISSVRKEMESKIPGLTLPKDISSIIAEQIMISLDANVTDISQIGKENRFSDHIFEVAVLPKLDMDDVKACIKANEENGIENAYLYAQISAMHEYANNPEKEMELLKIELPDTMRDLADKYTFYVPKDGEEYNNYGEKVNFVVKCNNGDKIVITDSKNPKHNVSKEHSMIIAEIEARRVELGEIKYICNEYPGNQELIDNKMKEYDDGLTGYAFDAVLEDVYEDIESYGVGILFDEDDQFSTRRLDILLSALQPEEASRRGLKDDSFAGMKKFGIMSQVYNYTLSNPEDERAKVALEKLKEIEPRLYSILKKDNFALEKLQTLAQNDYLDAVVAFLTETTDGIDKNAFIDCIEQVLENNKNLKIDNNYITPKIDYVKDIKPEKDKARRLRIEEANKSPKRHSKEEMLEIKKKSLIKMAEKNGVGKMLETNFVPMMIRDKELIEAVEEFLDPNKFGEENNLLGQLTLEDMDGLKNTISRLSQIESETSQRDLKVEGLIQFLGETISRETLRLKQEPLISAENVPAEQIFEQFSDGNELIEKNFQNRNKDLNDNEGPDSR